MSSAETEMDQVARPAKNSTPVTTRLVVSNLPLNHERVVGGMMSRSAHRRSVNDSLRGS